MTEAGSQPSEQPGPDEVERARVLREIYVYRDMVEGFMTFRRLTPENLGTAIAALQKTRSMMLQHGITDLPRR